MPTITIEYEAHLEKLVAGQIDRSALGADITSWGKRKGGLLSQERGAEADKVPCMTKMMKLATLFDAVETFSWNANKVLVSYSNLD